MEQETKKKIEELERKIRELEEQIKRIEMQSILIVGQFDGTNVPVTVTGVRRKIATVAP
jgi:ribosomal protein L29